MQKKLELIDTLWNVNGDEIIGFVTRGRELIDTLWNVNDITYEDIRKNMRINRYIMECKFACGVTMSYKKMRINRYIMECKFNQHLLFRT